MVDIEAEFRRNTVYIVRDGRHEVKCVLGLWSVEGPDKGAAMNEARHYFAQYFEDCEYD